MIDKNKIKPGDILMFRIVKSSGLFGRLIGWFSLLTGNGGTYEKTYAHVALVENVDYYLEQTFPKSKRTKLDCNNPEMELWRINNLSRENADKAIGWAKGNLGKWYNFRHLITLGFIKGYGCSDFLFNAFYESGTGIVLNKKGKGDPVCSPNEVIESGLLTCIDDGGHIAPKEKR